MINTAWPRVPGSARPGLTDTVRYYWQHARAGQRRGLDTALSRARR